MQRPQIQDKLLRYIFCCAPNLNTEFDRNDWNALFTLENYGGYNYNSFFLVVFRLADFFPRLFG